MLITSANLKSLMTHAFRYTNSWIFCHFQVLIGSASILVHWREQHTDFKGSNTATINSSLSRTLPTRYTWVNILVAAAAHGAWALASPGVDGQHIHYTWQLHSLSQESWWAGTNLLTINWLETAALGNEKQINSSTYFVFLPLEAKWFHTTL